ASLRTKLVRTMIAVLFVTASATILVVAGMSVIASRATLRTIEGHLRQGILTKGSGLVATQALALRDLVADNAFGDVARLIERTVEDDPQLSYGLFLGEGLRSWGYTTQRAPGGQRADPEGWRKLGVDTAKMREPGVKTRTLDLGGGESAFEFSTPVVDDGGAFLGSLRYALSDRSLREALADARAASRRTLATTVGLLLLLGCCTSALGIQLSRRAGTR